MTSRYRSLHGRSQTQTLLFSGLSEHVALQGGNEKVLFFQHAVDIPIRSFVRRHGAVTYI